MIFWLVVWNMFYFSFHIWDVIDVILLIDELIFIFFKMNQVCMFTKKMDMYCEWYEDLLSKDNNSMHYIL